MSTNEKLFFLWLLVVVAFRLIFHHFWAYTIEALGKVIAMNLVSLPDLAKFMSGVFGVPFPY